MGRTEKEAREYAKMMKEIHGEEWAVFKTPKGSQAYAQGLKFGTCRPDERADYEQGGAVFLDPPAQMTP
jgi:hypothetical protein